jgi:hypothetical protein
VRAQGKGDRVQAQGDGKLEEGQWQGPQEHRPNQVLYWQSEGTNRKSDKERERSGNKKVADTVTGLSDRLERFSNRCNQKILPRAKQPVATPKQLLLRRREIFLPTSASRGGSRWRWHRRHPW